MWLIEFLLFNLRVSTTILEESQPKIATRQWNRPVFGQTSIISSSRIFRSYKSSSLVKLETEQRSKLIISKANLISLYSLFPHLCCLADKRLSSLLSFFFFFFLPLLLRFLQRQKVFQGENRQQHRRDSLESSLPRSRSSVRRIECRDEEKKWMEKGKAEGSVEENGSWIRYFLPRGLENKSWRDSDETT